VATSLSYCQSKEHFHKCEKQNKICHVCIVELIQYRNEYSTIVLEVKQEAAFCVQQSRVLARMRYATTRSPRCCQQWTRLSQPISLRQLPPFQTLQCTRRGVSYVTKLHLEPHPPCVNFITVRALFVNFA